VGTGARRLLCCIRPTRILGSKARLCLRYLSRSGGVVRHRGRRSYLEARQDINRIARRLTGIDGALRRSGLDVDCGSGSKTGFASTQQTRPRRWCYGLHDASSRGIGRFANELRHRKPRLGCNGVRQIAVNQRWRCNLDRHHTGAATGANPLAADESARIDSWNGEHLGKEPGRRKE
jgi:hypothetical protein